MNRTFCDICKREILDEKQARYIRIVKITREFSDQEAEEKPDMPEKEVCSICSAKAKEYITKGF